MSNPKISIIVPIYNMEQYLRKCLDSILAQTLADYECWLIDDGSTDASPAICDDYAARDARFRVVHKENAGVSAARNTGLDNARGELLGFIDPDDWVAPTFVETAVSEMADADILCFGSVWHKDNGETMEALPVQGRADGWDEIRETLQCLRYKTHGWNNMGFAWNKVFRRELMEGMGLRFVDGLSVSEDEVFVLAYCLKAHSFKTIPTPLYHYTYKPTGLTHKVGNAKQVRLLAASFEPLLKQLPKGGLRTSIATYVRYKLLEAANGLPLISAKLLYCQAFIFGHRWGG